MCMISTVTGSSHLVMGIESSGKSLACFVVLVDQQLIRKYSHMALEVLVNNPGLLRAALLNQRNISIQKLFKRISLN